MYYTYVLIIPTSYSKTCLFAFLALPSLLHLSIFTQLFLYLYIYNVDILFFSLLSVKEDWNVVVAKCSTLSAHWESLSVFLGLSFSLIEEIKASYHNSINGYFNEALKNWIKQNYSTTDFGLPSWRTLLKAVARVDKLLFKRLADSHKGTQPINNVKYRFI